MSTVCTTSRSATSSVSATGAAREGTGGFAVGGLTGPVIAGGRGTGGGTSGSAFGGSPGATNFGCFAVAASVEAVSVVDDELAGPGVGGTSENGFRRARRWAATSARDGKSC